MAMVAPHITIMKSLNFSQSWSRRPFKLAYLPWRRRASGTASNQGESKIATPIKEMVPDQASGTQITPKLTTTKG